MTHNSSVISKVINNTISKAEILSWKDDRNHNLWHIFAGSDGNSFFSAISNKVSQQDLELKLSERNDLGDTPIHIATWSNNVNIIEFLNQREINFNNFTDNQNRTILFIATEMNYQKIIDICLTQDVDFEHTDHKGRSILQYAKSYDNQECVNKLLNLNNPAITTEESLGSSGSDEILKFFTQNKVALRGNKHF